MPPLYRGLARERAWQVRAVENLYPVLGDNSTASNLVFGLQQAIDGYGHHEVLVDHAEHGIALREMSQAHITLLIGACHERMAALYGADPRIQYVLVFKNFGPAAGASIHDRASGAVRHRIDVGQYVVKCGEKFIAIKPFASRHEWEVHILPLEHRHDFLSITPEEIEDFARGLLNTMARLNAAIGGTQSNFFLHSLPIHRISTTARTAITGTWRSARAPASPPGLNWDQDCM